MRGTGVSTVGLCHDALEVSSDGRFFPLSNLLFKSGAQQVRLSKPCKSPCICRMRLRAAGIR